MISRNRIIGLFAMLILFPLAHLLPANTGLDWNGTASVRRMLYWSNPFPIYSATYFFKVYQRQQVTGVGDGSRYYTTFFWGNNGSFTWGGAYDNSYYGAHPYPIPASTGDGKWEISIRANDYTTRDDGSAPYVVPNAWYNQAYVAQNQGSGNFYNRFYIALPSVTTLNRITVTFNDPSAPATPPHPAIVVGQAPDQCGPPPTTCGASWGGYSRWEEQNAVIRGMQFYNTALTEAQVLALSACETDAEVLAQCTTLGIAAPWYLNMNPTPTDVQDKSGRGHHPSWDGTGRPTLWSGGTRSEAPVNAAQGFRMDPCSPNPFHSKTLLSYSADAASAVHIRIYDQAGKIIRTFLERAGQSGRSQVEWDGRDQAGNRLADGIYVAGITVNNNVYTSRMVLLR
jgi:hypothetical protein